MNKRRRLRWDRVAIFAVALVAVIAGMIFLFSRLFQKSEDTAKPDAPAPTAEATAETVTKEKKFSLFITGDGLLHESVYLDAEREDGTYDFAKQLDRIGTIAEKYDLACYNQETILGGTEIGLSGFPVFNSPQEYGDYMVSKGFNLVSTANNHCLDMGTEGIVRSHDYWSQKDGVVMQGTNVSEEEYGGYGVKEINGVKVAFLSWTFSLNGLEPDAYWRVNYYPGNEETMLASVRKAKEECDVVIVAMHWGTEYSMEVNEEQFSLAEQLVDAGADVIVGNHVHVIEPFQWVNGKPVFYAMGNLISSQIDVENRIGMMAGMDITVNEDGTVAIDNLHADLHYTYLEGEYPELRTNIQVYPFSQLNDDILPGYKEIYEEFKAVITSLDQNIQIGGFQ